MGFKISRAWRSMPGKKSDFRPKNWGKLVRDTAQVPIKFGQKVTQIQGKLAYKGLKGLTGSKKLAGALASPFYTGSKALDKLSGSETRPEQYGATGEREKRLFKEGVRAGNVGAGIAGALVGGYFAAPALAGAGAAGGSGAGAGGAAAGGAAGGGAAAGGAAAGGGITASQVAAGAGVASVAGSGAKMATDAKSAKRKETNLANEAERQAAAAERAAREAEIERWGGPKRKPKGLMSTQYAGSLGLGGGTSTFGA